jgi:hypothetical protein
MRKTTTWVVFGCSWVLWLGCLYEPYEDGGSYTAAEVDGVGRSASYSVEAGWLAGDVPRVGEFEADAYDIEVNDYSVTLHTGERGGDHDGWAMTRLTLDLADVAAVTETTEIRVLSALGCTGPTHGDWDWDDSTDNVRVTVMPGATENEREVFFESDFDRGQTRGGFTVRIR